MSDLLALNWKKEVRGNYDVYSLPGLDVKIVVHREKKVCFTSHTDEETKWNTTSEFLENYSPEFPVFEEYILEVEATAITFINRKNCFSSPFDVFPLLEKAHAVVEATYVNSIGKPYIHWVVMDADQFQRYTQALQTFHDSKPNTVESLKALNILYFLTWSQTGPWITVFNKDESPQGWREAHCGDRNLPDPYGYAYGFCSNCDFQIGILYYLSDRGDFLRKLWESWKKHSQSCSGKLVY